MTDDPFEEPPGLDRGLAPIDVDALLACLPGPSSEGLSRDAIRQLYAQRQGDRFDDADFDAALLELEGGPVRTTTRRLNRVRVPLYRRAAE